MSIRLFLVRHGNTFNKGDIVTQVGLKTDLPLTEKGREQAKNVADFFQKNNITPSAIYAGNLSRQQETAEIISDIFSINPVLFEDCLTEIDYGPWEGLTTEQIMAQWPNEYLAWTQQAVWPEQLFSEKLSDRLNAIHAWIDALRAQYQDGDVVVGVTSNGIIRFFYSFMQEEWKKLIDEKRMEELKVGTGCFCELVINKNYIEIINWNVKV